MTDLMTRLRTAAAYRMATTITETIVSASVWQHRQAEALEAAIAEIERLTAENNELRKGHDGTKAQDSGADR